MITYTAAQSRVSSNLIIYTAAQSRVRSRRTHTHTYKHTAAQGIG